MIIHRNFFITRKLIAHHGHYREMENPMYQALDWMAEKLFSLLFHL